MRKIAILSLTLLTAGAASAQEIVCTLTSGGQGFMSPVILFGLPTADSKAFVYDAVIDAAKGEPIAAKVTSKGEDVLRFRWRVTNIPATPSNATVGYWADLNTATLRVRVSGTIRGFDNDIKGRGNCEQR